MSQPAVSVIMPVYNAERFLECSVGSVLAQTCGDWELICFNDASTDGSLDRLNAYAEADHRIRVIDSAVNVKQGAGRNRAIREARGEFVMFLDADDSLAPEAVAMCLDTARRNEADMVLFDYRLVPGNVMSPLGQQSEGMHGDDLRLRLIRNPSPVWSAMYRRTLITDNGLYFPERVFYEDNAVALAIQLSAHAPIKVNAALYEYHIYDSSVSHRINDYRFFHRLGSAVTLKAHLQRLGLYERWREPIDFLLINQYYVHSIFGCVYRFDRVPILRHRYIRATIGRVVSGYRNNPSYRARPKGQRLKIILHTRFPRLLNLLWRAKRTLSSQK